MKKYILFALFLSLLLVGCKTKYVHIPVETVRTETNVIRDTIVDVKLELIRDSVVVPDTISFIENKYSTTYAKFSQGKLHHSLSIKDVEIPVEVKYIEKEVITKTEVPVPYPVVEYVKKPFPIYVWFSIIFTIFVGILQLLKIFKR